MNTPSIRGFDYQKRVERRKRLKKLNKSTLREGPINKRVRELGNSGGVEGFGEVDG